MKAIECEECGKKIDVEEIVCLTCYKALKQQIEELRDEIASLNESYRELENTILALEDE